MNARQKAKKYKRINEALLNQPVKFKVEQYKIDTLGFERFFYPKDPILQNDNCLQEVIAEDIAQGIANNLYKYIDYNIEFCPHINMHRFYGEIKILERTYTKDWRKDYDN